MQDLGPALCANPSPERTHLALKDSWQVGVILPVSQMRKRGLRLIDLAYGQVQSERLSQPPQLRLSRSLGTFQVPSWPCSP